MRVASLLFAVLIAWPAATAAAQHAVPHSIALDASAYRVFTAAGRVSSLEALLAATAAVDVVLLGESHNDVVGHRLQHEIFARILERDAAGTSVVLSLEMFDRDVQYIVDEYLAGLISADQFRRSTRPWKHYDADYAPTVELARRAGAAVLAANAPRRYVNLVSREGPAALEALSAEALRTLPPLPWAPPSEAYVEELDALMGPHRDSTARHSATSANGYLAQSLWDAAMAFSIADALLRKPRSRIVHLVGSFHVRNGTGIPEQLEHYRPGTSRLIVLIQPVKDMSAFPAEFAGAADFVILTDASRARPPDPPGGS